MEKLFFPKKTYNLTQGFGNNSYSHKNRKALDVNSYGGDKKIYAPFSGYVAKVYVKSGAAYTIWLVSNSKLLCSNGKKQYVVCMLTHPTEIKNFKVGDIFNQDDYLMNDGKTGNATGDHLDIEIATYDNKKDIKANWHNVNGDYGLINAVNPCEVMFLKDDTKVFNEKYNNIKYQFIKDDDYYVKGTYKLLYDKCIRSSAKLTNNIIKVKNCSKETLKYLTSKKLNDNAKIKKGTNIIVSKIVNDSGRVWGKYGNCYVVLCNIDGTKQALKVTN